MSVSDGDLAGTVALRMDDPGASASVQLDGWGYEKLEPGLWEAVGDALGCEGARLSIGYTPGWVDDGDPARGELLVDGEPVERVPGRVHPSPLVEYRGRSAPSADCAAEFAAIHQLRDRGLASVELHGYAHVHPDRERWARSATAHSKLGWYRELGPEVSGAIEDLALEDRPLALGLRLFREYFEHPPAALLCPGNACAPTVVTHAYELGLEVIVTHTLAVRGVTAFEWRNDVREVWLDGPTPQGLADGVSIGLFHDRDLALYGPEWLAERLASWRAAGVRRFVDVAELAARLRPSLRARSGA